jgi:hypothetical protein
MCVSSPVRQPTHHLMKCENKTRILPTSAIRSSDNNIVMISIEKLARGAIAREAINTGMAMVDNVARISSQIRACWIDKIITLDTIS